MTRTKFDWRIKQLQQVANGERRIHQAGVNAKYELCSIAKRCMTIYSNRWLAVTRKLKEPNDSYIIYDGDGNGKVYNGNFIV